MEYVKIITITSEFVEVDDVNYTLGAFSCSFARCLEIVKHWLRKNNMHTGRKENNLLEEQLGKFPTETLMMEENLQHYFYAGNYYICIESFTVTSGMEDLTFPMSCHKDECTCYDCKAWSDAQ